MNSARTTLMVLGALAAQTTLARFLPVMMAPVDLVLVCVVYVALKSGPTTGLFAGTLAGLAQDALTSGVLGIGGLAKTVIGFAAGRVGTQFILTAAPARFVVFLAATLVHGILVVGLYRVLDLRTFPSPVVAVLEQAVANAVIGVLCFQAELVPGGVARWRMARGRLRR